MAYLKDYGYQVLGFDEFIKLKAASGPAPRKSVVITFDDGYEDNYTNAFPVLKKYGYPAIIFLPTDLIGQKGHMTWEQVAEMSRYGIAFGSHGRRHEYLPDLTVEQQRDEIFESKRILQERLRQTVDYFAYPIGGFNDTIKKMVQEAGYKAAASTNRSYDRYNKDLFELNRIRFGDKDVRNDYLWIKLSGYYNLFREAKNPH
jgi:peptidoglycan/xylan/chitin deacetylase (PgdA/CDA1 family)